VAAVQAERIFERVEPLAGHLVAAVDEPAIRLEQDRGPQELVAVPPITRTRRRAARAQDALVQPVDLAAILNRLEALAVGWGRGDGLEPRLDRRILGVEVLEIRDKVLDHIHVRQRRDPHLALDIRDRLGARERVRPVDVHAARPANALATRPAEGQRRIYLGLDLDQRVEDHRPCGVEVELIAIIPRVGPVIGVPAIDFERLGPLRSSRRGVALAVVANARVGGEGEFGHQYTRAFGLI